MGLALSRSNLVSRVTRAAITGGKTIRRLDLSPKLNSNQQDGSGQAQGIALFIKTIKGFASRFFGFVSALIKGVQITVSGIFNIVVQTVQNLSTFDWNASENELRATMRARNIQLASTWGGAIGSGAGWIAGIGVGYGLTVLCPVIGSASLARIAAGETSIEALQEIRATTANALRVTAATLGTNLTISTYIRIRRGLGLNPADDAPSWTIAGKIEEKIDSIQNPAIKGFVEEFTDEFFDSFIESGYVFAHELDSQLAAARAAKSAAVERQITLTPDIQSPDEKIVLTGAEPELKETVRSTLVQHRLIANRDIGQIVGQPAEDWYKAHPQRRKLTIIFDQRPNPPWRLQKGSASRRAEYSIPEPKVNLKWEQIKRAAKPYNWGRFRVTANLTNGRQMAVYGASPKEAEEKLKELIDLSTCEIMSANTSEERIRHPKLKKENTRMYPAYGNLLVRKSSTDGKGRTDLDGKSWESNHIRFALWTEREPSNFKEIIW